MVKVPIYLTVLIPFDIYALLLLLLQLLSGSVEADPVPRHRWQPTGQSPNSVQCSQQVL